MGGRREVYTDDPLYRLTQESIIDPLSGNRTTDYSFDSVGNHLTKTDSLTGLTAYSYDAGDRLTTETNGSNITSYGHDKNGNTLSQLKNANDQITYNWDYENRLNATNIVTPTGTKQITYRYDANEIRVGQTVDGVKTRYLIDANRPYAQVLEEYNGSDIQASYVYGNSLISQMKSNG
ncbi:hypothetical protein Syn7502_02661 [Synechococcus sp. PCC 7502]|uniref:hypothetical protein n=1 Tax=Synechococcus sp. PCC 7502 TaxID=1173263 RepID=UPI00029FD395|nr:hypothetical protein [Synechococcus sp. PCC 7502]AFY74620.1 hypothetical protein Syn7502_02661 [Synechococcus sp. PCC 7502]